MDEVDNIIIHSLRQIGCKINEDVISLSNFSPELLVETVSKCLRLIKPSLILPETLPSGMAQRFTVTASLAEACASIGFRGDIGYQTFLYSNVTEIRRVFMFLIERLPKETEKLPLIQPLDKLTSLENEICRNISVQLSNAWIPQYCNKFGVRKYNLNTLALNSNSTKFKPQLNLNVPNSLIQIEDVTVTSTNDSKSTKTIKTNISPELYNYWLKRSPNIFQQTNSQTICSSIIHKNDIEYYNNDDNENMKNYEKLLSKIYSQKNQEQLKMKFNLDILTNKNLITTSISKIIDKNTTDENKLKQQQQHHQESSSLLLSNNLKTLGPLDELNLYIEKIKTSIKDLLTARKIIQLEIQNLNESRYKHDEILQKLKDEKKIKERTFILLENPEDNLIKMEQIINVAHERMKNLKKQWEEHRKPLIEALEKTKSKNTNKMSQSKIIMDQVKTIREKISDITEELKIKTALHQQLLNELQKVNKATTRNAYTTRILEIIGNIRKQKNDIDRVLRDTRELQKQINNITGQLDRQFTVTDDLLYKTAKRDEHSKKAYKLLAKLHSDCSDLVNLVQQTGAIMREVRDLEDQIEKEKSRNINTNLEKITFDLKQMEKESKELQQKIRQVENQITQG